MERRVPGFVFRPFVTGAGGSANRRNMEFHPDLDRCKCGDTREQHDPNDGCALYIYCGCLQFEPQEDE